jgi:hypothetical protein
LGFLDSIPILSANEVDYFRGEVEETCAALGGRITRLDGPHLYFRWAWELSTHPRVLDCMEQLIGPNIMLKSTRLFYKFGKSDSFVGWHQDGLTEQVKRRVSARDLVGTDAGDRREWCLRVVRGRIASVWCNTLIFRIPTISQLKARRRRCRSTRRTTW